MAIKRAQNAKLEKYFQAEGASGSLAASSVCCFGRRDEPGLSNGTFPMRLLDCFVLLQLKYHPLNKNVIYFRRGR